MRAGRTVIASLLIASVVEAGPKVAATPSSGASHEPSVAAMPASSSRLVAASPISANIGSVSDSRRRFKILCGSDRGLLTGFHMVIWRDGSHGPVGIASGTVDGVTPDSVGLRVDAWNEGEPCMKPFVVQIKASGIGALSDRLFVPTAEA